MFNVICLETGAIVDTITNGKDAAIRAKELTEATGKKHQPRPVKSDVDWRERERNRFLTREYTPLPWVHSYWFEEGLTASGKAHDHFPHVSVEEPGKIAFTESPEKGELDRQTRMRPGRYLQQYFGEALCTSDIKRLAGQFAGMYEPLELLFASTADEIERVYTSGPNSCMSHPAKEYQSPFHPVRVYAAGDLQVAYLASKAPDENGNRNITARALAWPEKKKYSRIYGDECRLAAALDQAGYTNGNLDGAKLVKHKCDSGYVLPYIDVSFGATDCGEHLKIKRGGEICGEATNGITEEGETCDRCGDTMGRNDGCYVEDVGETWCEYCRDNYTFYCDHHDDTVSGDETVSMANGDTWCQSCFESDGFTCEGNDRNYRNDERVELADGTVWSQAYFDRNGFDCVDCNELHAAEDRHADHCDCCESCGDERIANDDSQAQAEAEAQSEMAV